MNILERVDALKSLFTSYGEAWIRYPSNKGGTEA
jgi:hypothetical protein